MGGNVGDGDAHYPALPCATLQPWYICLSFSIPWEIMHKRFWVYPASNGERPTKDTGTHEEHASQHRPTTHPPLGVPLQFGPRFTKYLLVLLMSLHVEG